MLRVPVMKAMRVLMTLWLGAAWGGARGQAVPTTNGLYAAFNTSMGTFYCNLRYDLTPRTVANFIGLAEGSKTWLDYSKAALSNRPFYNGLTFHRVVTNFVIQSGSPNGLGTDDPGYQFRNEIVAGLNQNSAGALAMANAGTTNSNGSQFYVTLSPQPELNGNYTVFGGVVEGLDVVTNIGAVAVDANDKPLVPVLLNSVTILRIGASASNFNAAAVSPALPAPAFKAAQMVLQPPNLILVWDELANYEYRLCYSSDLNNWQGFYVGAYAGRYMNDFRGDFPWQFFVAVESKID
jgi:peptidylprolyl isomerase